MDDLCSGNTSNFLALEIGFQAILEDPEFTKFSCSSIMMVGRVACVFKKI